MDRCSGAGRLKSCPRERTSRASGKLDVLNASSSRFFLAQPIEEASADVEEAVAEAFMVVVEDVQCIEDAVAVAMHLIEHYCSRLNCTNEQFLCFQPIQNFQKS